MSNIPKPVPAYTKANYYYLSNKVIFGPITAHRVQELYLANSILPTDTIWMDSIEGNGIPLKETELGRFLALNQPLPKAAIRFNNVTDGMLQPLVDRPQFLPLADEVLPHGTVRTANSIYAELTLTSSILLIMLVISIGLSIALFVTHGLNNNAAPPPAPITIGNSPANSEFDPYQQTLNPYQQPQQPQQPTVPKPTRNNDLRDKIVLLASLMFSLLTMLTYYAWLYQAFQNVHALGANGLNFTPGWAVGCHLVPILNLWKPFQALHQLCRASASVRNWKHPSPTPLAGAFWLFFLMQSLFTSIAIHFYSRAAITSNAALLNDARSCFQIACITGIICMLSLGGLVLDVTKRQHQQYEKIKN